MQSPNYPDQPQPQTWWQRNWKWFVPVFLLVGFLLFAGFIASLFWFITSTFKSSVVYQEAMGRALANPQVQEYLGTPIEAGLIPSGQINVSGPTGRADLSIPISGPKGEGIIYLQAHKSMGTWEFDALEVEIKSPPERIYLLSDSEED